MERIHIGKTAEEAVNAYLEYRRIVGEDDGGRLFTQAEFAEYKKRVVPSRLRNRLYVSFGVPGTIDCKLIGPETLCFCLHRYKQHRTDFVELPKARPIFLPCAVQGCQCVTYQYVHHRPQGTRCQCKHLCSDHREAADHLCKKCNTCTGFQSPYTCGCGQPGHAHVTLVETREEREGRGLPVGMAVPYAAMGGLSGFSSLADGYLRLDPSGSGSPLHDALDSAEDDTHRQCEGACVRRPHTPQCQQDTVCLQTPVLCEPVQQLCLLS
ncbi:protein FAM221A isoform X3 [Brachyhypopomus gauderio]|uniref:protein FAM221A isoform X3 n=1 Tax=Brachyhypopomus gauderio TaxID=698409 RepID=UPI004040FB80